MAANIKSATVTVTLEAESAKFAQAMDRARQQAHTSTNGIIKSLANAQRASAAWADATTKAFFAPFKAFQKAIYPFKTMVSQVIGIAKNLMHPFVQLASYVSGPFVRVFKAGFEAAKRVLTGFGVAAAAAGAAIGFMMHDVAEQTLELAKWSAMLGISVKTLNKISYSARIMGMSIEEVGDSMATLTEKIADTAQAGGGLEDFFNMISNHKGPKDFIKIAKEWNQLAPDKQLEKYMQQLDKMDTNTAVFFAKEISDSFADMVAMTKLSGKSFKELQAEAERFGGDAAGATGFVKMKAALGAWKYEVFNIFNAVGDRLAQPAADALNYLQNEFNNWVASYDTKKHDLKTGFDLMVKDVTKKTMLAIGYAMKGLGSFIDTLQQVFNSIGELLEKYTSFKMPESQKGINSLAREFMTPEQKALETELTNQIKLMGGVIEGQQKLTAEQRKAISEQGIKTTKEKMFTGDIIPIDDSIVADNAKRKAEIELKALQDAVNSNVSASNLFSKGGNALITTANNLNIAPSTDGERTSKNKTLGRSTADRDMASTAKADADKIKEIQKAITTGWRDLADLKVSLGIGDKTSGWAAEVAAAQNQLNDKYVDMTENANKLTNKTQRNAELEKIKADKETTRLKLQDAMQTKLNEAIEKMRDSVGGLAEKIQLQMGMQGKGQFAGLTKEQRQFKQETADGVESIKSQYDEQLKQAEYAYGQESKQYKDLVEEKKRMVKEFTDFRVSEEQRANATVNGEGPLVEFANALNAKEGALDQHASVIQGYNNQEIADTIKTEKGKKELALNAGGQLLAESAKTSKKAFEMQKMLNIGTAVMNTATGISKALAEGGPFAGPALAAMMAAMGAIQIQQIRSQQFVGQFHSGIDALPETGTYIGQKNERVVDSMTNRDLKTFLYDTNKRGASDMPAYSPTYNITAAVSANDLEQLIKKDPNKYRRLLAS